MPTKTSVAAVGAVLITGAVVTTVLLTTDGGSGDGTRVAPPSSDITTAPFPNTTDPFPDTTTPPPDTTTDPGDDTEYQAGGLYDWSDNDRFPIMDFSCYAYDKLTIIDLPPYIKCLIDDDYEVHQTDKNIIPKRIEQMDVYDTYEDGDCYGHVITMTCEQY